MRTNLQNFMTCKINYTKYGNQHKIKICKYKKFGDFTVTAVIFHIFLFA